MKVEGENVSIGNRINKLEMGLGGQGGCLACGGQRNATLYDLLLADCGKGPPPCVCQGTPLADLLERAKAERASAGGS